MSKAAEYLAIQILEGELDYKVVLSKKFKKYKAEVDEYLKAKGFEFPK